MERLKKIITILTVFVLCACFTGCSSGNSTSNANNRTTKVSQISDNDTENAEQDSIFSEDISNTQSEIHNSQMTEDEIADLINEILSTTPACEGWAPTISKMVNTVFFDYEWTFEPYSSSGEIMDGLYVVEITGNYCPNPDIPNLSQNGTIRYFVNIDSEKVSIHSDPHGISSTFMVYILN